MDFDPDAFLAQANQTAPSMPKPASMQSVAPQTGAEGFDPDAFLSDANEAKYGTLEQQVKTGVEGVGKGLIGPFAPLAEKHLLGIKEEDILGREKENPITSGLGQAAGLTAGALTGTGEAAVMGKAGELVSTALGLAEPTSLAARIGSSAVQQAAEMAVLQSGDEIGKQILHDPEASAQTALANIGLATALGGAGGAFVTGAISPLWKATIGSKAETLLRGVRSKLGGVEGEVTKEAEGLARTAGIELPGEIKAVLDDAPGAREAHSALSQTDTSFAGRSYQKTLNSFYDNAGDKAAETLGVNPSALENLPELDKYATGRNLADTLKEELKAKAEPIQARYDAINKEFKHTVLSNEDKKLIADRIGQKSIDEGWHKAESEAQQKLAERTIHKVSQQETVEDLKKFITNLRDAHPFGSETYQAGKTIRKILEDAQERAVTGKIMAPGVPGMPAQNMLRGLVESKLAEYTGLKAEYAKLMSTIDNLNEHLHVGKYYGPDSFLKALSESGTTSGENMLNRMSGTNKAEILTLLKEFPKTLTGVKQYHVDKLLDTAVSKARPGSKINVNNLVTNIDKLSPQLKALVASPEQHSRISAINQIIEGLKDSNHNWSNTARTVDKLLHGTPSAISLVAALAGHAEAGILSYLAKIGFTEGKDAVKLGLMRFLGSDAPVKSEGLKSMMQFIDNAAKGESLLLKATGNVFKRGAQVLTDKAMPGKEDREKLNKIVIKYQEDPQSLMQKLSQGQTGHYFPQHQAALAQITTQQLQYLQQIKPQPIQANPLDKPIEPSQAQVARYNKALDIANSPSIVLQRVKDGTIQVTDLQDLKALYPSLYPKMTKMLTDRMIKHTAEDAPIPYNTRIGLSIFMGQPMDATMQPASIQSAQPMPKQSPQAPQGMPKPKKGTSTLGKHNSQYMTPSQNAESDRSTRH